PVPPAPGAAPAGKDGAAADGETEGKPEAGGSSAVERKVVNDAIAYTRSLAELRGRNAEWAEQAVRGAASLPASAALEQKVIDVISPDLPDLLKSIDGREVHVANGVMKLTTRDLTVVHVQPDWRTRLLAVITN